MSWVAVGVTTAAVVGGAVQANSAKRASDKQAAAEGQALNLQNQQLNLSRADQQPWVETGRDALSLIRSGLGMAPRGADLQIDRNDPRYKEIFQNIYDRVNQEHIQRYGVNVGIGSGDGEYANQINAIHQDAANEFAKKYATPQAGDGNPMVGSLIRPFTTADFENDPVNQLSFKYGMDLGTKAIDRGAGASGLRNSGATLKALTRFGQDYAGSKANESRNRFMNFQDTIYNRLAGLSGTGQTATTQTGAMGVNTANNIGNILTAGGNARGAAAIAQGNAYGGTLNNVANYYGQQATLDKILNSRQPSQPYYTGTGAGGDYQYG